MTKKPSSCKPTAIAVRLVRGCYFIHSGGMILPHALRHSRVNPLTGRGNYRGGLGLPGFKKKITKNEKKMLN
jgi:hypothetical protein